MGGKTHAPEEVGSACRASAFGFRDKVVVAQFVQGPISIPRIANPKCSVKVTNAARTLLQIWFLEAHGRAKLCVPRGPLAQDRRNVSMPTLTTILFESLQEGIVG